VAVHRHPPPDSVAEVDLFGDDPRDVTITGTGPRGLELEASLADRD
jgi:hypothetical protein